MTALKRKRKGFSLVEMVAVAIILAIITISVTFVSQAVSVLRTQQRNSIYLSTHNLNVMEQIRREMNQLGETGELPSYYGDVDGAQDTGIEARDFSTTEIATRVYITKTPWDNFHVYSVRIESRVRGYVQRLNSTYILTDIGIEKDPTVTLP